MHLNEKMPDTRVLDNVLWSCLKIVSKSKECSLKLCFTLQKEVKFKGKREITFEFKAALFSRIHCMPFRFQLKIV